MVESDAAAVAAMEQNRRLLRADGLVFRRDTVQHFLAHAAARRFDIVFLDPPFSMPETDRVFRLLEEGDWLSERALIYVESAARAGPIAIPPAWGPWRRRQAGEVDYALYRREEAV